VEDDFNYINDIEYCPFDMIKWKNITEICLTFFIKILYLEIFLNAC
jgi:hypothetical protein